MPTQMIPVIPVVTRIGIAIYGSLSAIVLLKSGSDDEEDETAELLRELEKIKKERAEKQAQEVCHSDHSQMLSPANMGYRSG